MKRWPRAGSSCAPRARRWLESSQEWPGTLRRAKRRHCRPQVLEQFQLPSFKGQGLDSQSLGAGTLAAVEGQGPDTQCPGAVVSAAAGSWGSQRAGLRAPTPSGPDHCCRWELRTTAAAADQGPGQQASNASTENISLCTGAWHPRPAI
jgi:hypothetical protein